MTLIRNKTLVTGLLLAAMTTTTLAPVAEAGSKRKWRDRDHRSEERYRGDRDGRSRGDRDGKWRSRDWDKRRVREVRYVERTYHRPAYRSSRYGTYVVRRSNAGPVIAGFIGGLFLGATLANTPPRGYDYYDPYCHQRFSTLNQFHREAYAHRHTHELRVVSCESEWGCRGGHHSDGHGHWHDDY
jgi:hypothetical protein